MTFVAKSSFNCILITRSISRHVRLGAYFMAVPISFFTCPNCQALYQLVKAEGGPESGNDDVSCRSWGAPMPGRDGEFVLKYFTCESRARARIEKQAALKTG